MPVDKIDCSECDGLGSVIIDGKLALCSACDGDGEVEREENEHMEDDD